MHNLLYILLRVLSRMLGSRFYDDFSLRGAMNSMYEEGVTSRASGFVFEGEDGAFGIYLLRYGAVADENLDGRWN